MELDDEETKLIISLGASFTLFTLFLISEWKGSPYNQTSVTILLFMLTSLLGIDLARRGAGGV